MSSFQEAFDATLFWEYRGLLLGGLAFLSGTALIAAAALEWRSQGFGPLDYAQTMRWVIPGVTLSAGHCDYKWALFQ